MQIKIIVDCTPEEARAFLGLPDVSPLHDVYLDRMKALMEKGITPDMVGELVKSWSSMGDAGIAVAQQLFGQLGSTLTGGLGGKKGGQS
ncbi:MAG: hypothetical protein K2X31_08005 [Sphingopyxis sp.]|nr:hypothetical protein [Sphingopyxis sp.]